MTSSPANLFIKPRATNRADPGPPSQRTSIEERKQAMLAENPEDYQNESGFGHIKGIPVGKTWSSRAECASDRMHTPLTAGIWGGKDGAFSIVMSGGYEDDVDEGYFIKYTGAGGLGEGSQYGGGDSWKGAIQTDQNPEHVHNKPLFVSREREKPVRVIRGSGLGTKWSPENGFRYDGIYKVTKAYTDKSKDGTHEICRFELKREPGQPPIPERWF